MLRDSRGLRNRVEESRRRNQRRFAARVHGSFRRLYHETFHAYWANFLADEEKPLPRWLNEGLAQIFESAQLDEDQLRIDAPDPQRLARLRGDLAEQPLPLQAVLGARARDFHAAADLTLAPRLYDYAWGLTFWLVFEHRLLDRPRWWEMFQLPRQQRWQALAGATPDQLQRQWQAAMQALD